MKNIFLFLLMVLSLSPFGYAKEKKNYYGLEFLIGGHHNAPLVDDLKTHKSSVGNDTQFTNPRFDETTNLVYGAAFLYERAINPKNRLGLMIGLQSIGIGHLQEYVTPVSQPSDTVNRKFSVNGSQRYISIYYRRLYGNRVKFAPLLGLGLSHLRATVDIDESDDSFFIGTGDEFAESYKPQEKWVPNALIGIDVLMDLEKITYGVGLSIQRLFDAEFDQFRTNTHELRMINGRLKSLPISDRSGRSFQTDFSDFIFSLSLKMFI